jgi:hypothetical protein
MNRVTALELILLAAWLGAAILVAAVVAPVSFRVLPSRTLAGAVVGSVLPVIFLFGLVIAMVAVVLEARAKQGFGVLAILPFAAMIIGCVIAQFVIGPKIEAIRAAIPATVEALDPADPRRIQFGRLHGYSVLLMGVAMLGAAAAIGRKFLGTNTTTK